MAEDAKKIGQESKGDDASTAAGGDSFLERLVIHLNLTEKVITSS